MKWIGIQLPVQGTQVWSLVQKDPTHHGATESTAHSYWALELQLLSLGASNLCSAAKAPRQWEAPPCNERAARTQQWRPRAARASNTLFLKKSLKWTKTKQKVLHSWLRIGSNRKRTFEIRRKHIKAIVAKPKDSIEVLGERLRECTRKKGMWS